MWLVLGVRCRSPVNKDWSLFTGTEEWQDGYTNYSRSPKVPGEKVYALLGLEERHLELP